MTPREPVIKLPPVILNAAKRIRLRGDYGVVLMIDGGYFIQREVASAFQKIGWRVEALRIEPEAEYIERLLTAIVTVKPDLLFTVNHIGFDAGGAVAAIVDQVELPTLSWFVDSPAYILLGAPGAVSPHIVTAVWERAEIKTLKAFGFDAPFHLPLAADPEVMRVGTESAKEMRAGFVGDSMKHAVAKWRAKLRQNDNIDLMIDRQVESILSDRQNSPLPQSPPTDWGLVERLNFSSAVVLEATRRYRWSALGGLSGIELAVWGDEGWDGALHANTQRFDRVDYYSELPAIYARTAVNLNFTSFQMPSAVNQRLFDAPAAGGFLLTDYQGDVAELFDPEEVACFSNREELPGLIRYYLGRSDVRERIALKARKRILAEHTYVQRVTKIVAEMKRRFPPEPGFSLNRPRPDASGAFNNVGVSK